MLVAHLHDWQAEGEEAPPLEYVPEGQTPEPSLEDAPSRQYRPGGQDRQLRAQGWVAEGWG